MVCREQGTARSAGEVASSARRHAPSKRHTYVFDKASQATSISSGGLWGCRGGNEQIARGWIIASRERLIFFCRVEEQSAPETRASAFPRRGGDATVPSYEARRRRSPSGRVSPHRDERDNLGEVGASAQHLACLFSACSQACGLAQAAISLRQIDWLSTSVARDIWLGEAR